MAKSKPTRDKVFLSPQEVEEAIEKLRARIAQVDELKKDGLPYRDALRVTAEFQIRETIREIYGEKSPEFQEHEHHRIYSLTKTEIAETLVMLQGLITDLEDKKLELLAGKRPAARPHGGPPAGVTRNAVVARERPTGQHQASALRSGAAAMAGPMDALGRIRKICMRFHEVARHLRQRREDRPTLEVEDEHDVRDVLNSLLSLEFEGISTEEWTPRYARSTKRMDLVLPRERIVIVVIKTKPGLGAKEVADQLTTDSQHYAAHRDCQTLFCFVYDPEGRIGDPQRLEADLTSTSGDPAIEVLIAPK
ncbi:MAG: hypothetical protein ACREIL_05785 [Nitrospiraceae bacterium]